MISTLNSKLFQVNDSNTYTMKPEIRHKLLEIAEAFKAYLAEDGLNIDVIDIRVVGSNAGYDYNDTSDLDLHLVADLDNICCDSSIVQVALNAEKQRFNSSFDISVKGIPVELYVEDVKSGVNSNGIYSLIRDSWIRYPEIESPIPAEQEAEVINKTNQWISLINKALSRNNENELQHIINRLYLMRKDGLDSVGPKSCGNLIFKNIRKQGYLDRLKQSRDEAISERLTMECRIAQEALKYGSLN